VPLSSGRTHSIYLGSRVGLNAASPDARTISITLRKIPVRGVIVTVKPRSLRRRNSDFVARSSRPAQDRLRPGDGIGAHRLGPYWAERLARANSRRFRRSAARRRMPSAAAGDRVIVGGPGRWTVMTVSCWRNSCTLLSLGALLQLGEIVPGRVLVGRTACRPAGGPLTVFTPLRFPIRKARALNHVQSAGHVLGGERRPV